MGHPTLHVDTANSLGRSSQSSVSSTLNLGGFGFSRLLTPFQIYPYSNPGPHK
jgi:hypothetical protein